MTRAAATPSLVVMAKPPRLGMVKTRLAAAIGAAAALDVYRELLEITAAVARAWPGPVVLAADGDPVEFAVGDFPTGARVRQPEGGLGPRIAAALRAGLAHADRAIVIGSDCPAANAAVLQQLAALLADAPVAFGPASDGGFWALATTTSRTADVVAAAAVPWSSPTTLAALRAALADAGLAIALGPALADCDTVDDLQRARAAGMLRAAKTPRGAS